MLGLIRCGARSEQRVNDCGVALLAGDEQRCRTASVSLRLVDVRAFREEARDLLGAAVSHRVDERRVAVAHFT